MKDRPLTLEQVAERWSVPVRDVQNMARDGKLPAFKVARQWRVSFPLLQRYEAMRGAR